RPAAGFSGGGGAEGCHSLSPPPVHSRKRPSLDLLFVFLMAMVLAFARDAVAVVGVGLAASRLPTSNTSLPQARIVPCTERDQTTTSVPMRDLGTTRSHERAADASWPS